MSEDRTNEDVYLDPNAEYIPPSPPPLLSHASNIKIVSPEPIIQSIVFAASDPENEQTITLSANEVAALAKHFLDEAPAVVQEDGETLEDYNRKVAEDSDVGRAIPVIDEADNDIDLTPDIDTSDLPSTQPMAASE